MAATTAASYLMWEAIVLMSEAIVLMSEAMTTAAPYSVLRACVSPSRSRNWLANCFWARHSWNCDSARSRSASRADCSRRHSAEWPVLSDTIARLYACCNLEGN